MMRSVRSLRVWLWNYFAHMTRTKLLVVLLMNALVVGLIACQKDDMDIPKQYQHPSDRGMW